MLGSGDPEKQALVYAEVTNPQSLNKYQHAFNNPLRYVDPDGQNPQDGHELRLRRDEKALAEGKMSPEEFMARRKAEAAGAVVGLATLAALRGGVPVAIAIWRWATQNPDKVQQLGVELSQASTGSPVSGPPGLTVSAGTRLTASEISTGVRLAEQAGLRLSQSSHIGAEFVSATGKTYDAMGSVTAYASRNWGNGSQFFNSILKHVNKSVDYVAIDLAGASKGQTQAIEKYVSGLTKEQRAKIIYVR